MTVGELDSKLTETELADWKLFFQFRPKPEK